MKILTALTYYTPHVSGLTVYARRVVKAMVERGHTVTVLTSHYDRSLPREEMIDGARVIRVPVAFRFSKGVIMPTLPWHAARLSMSHDLVYLHLPQFEACVTATIARFLARKPVVTKHHCDILLPNRFLRMTFWLPIAISHRISASLSSQIVVSSRDYGENSAFLRRYQHKLLAVYPPMPEAQPDPSNPLNLRDRYHLNSNQVVGFVGRFAEDKGVRFLIDSIPRVLQHFPNARFLFVGEREKVVGEKTYDRLEAKMKELQEHIVLLGVLSDSQLAEFYRDCDVLALPSINSTEAFGMVQVEAMLKGTPVIATDLPGVRVAIQATGMGEIVPPRDEKALADAIVRVLSDRRRYVKRPDEIRRIFDPQKTFDFYEDLVAAELGMPPLMVSEEEAARSGRQAS